MSMFIASPHFLESVYRNLIQSVLSFNIVTWYGNLKVENRAKLSRVVSTACKLIGAKLYKLSFLYQLAVKRKATQILCNTIHPLNICFERIPSGRRFKLPIARRTFKIRSSFSKRNLFYTWIDNHFDHEAYKCA